MDQKGSAVDLTDNFKYTIIAFSALTITYNLVMSEWVQNGADAVGLAILLGILCYVTEYQWIIKKTPPSKS